LEIAVRKGADPESLLIYAYTLTGPHRLERLEAQKVSLIRNRVILERLGCLDAAGLEMLRKGKALTITKGPYAGELATVDHTIPRSICLELDNRLFNLEFMPATRNQRKSNKISQRQRDLARR